MPRGKNQLERIYEIDRRVRSGAYPSKKIFTDLFEVTNKSIERDFEFMRERLGTPLCYSTEHRGYYYSEPSYFLPGDMMNDSELFALLMSKQIVGSMGNSPIKDSLEGSCRILSKYLPEDLKTDIGISLSRFTIISDPSVVIEDNQWHLVLSSLRENLSLIFDYKTSAQKNDYSKRVFFPYHIVSWRGSWYVIGHNPEKGRIETYAISRMKGLKTGKTFPFPTDFDVNKYVDDQYGLYVDSEIQQVSIRFESWCAPYIRERVWHKAQSIEELDNGGLILRFETDQMETTRQWILRWGSGAVVLEPLELVDTMRKLIKELANQYKLIK